MNEHITPKILVIEEHSSIRNDFLQGLSKRGFEAIGARNSCVGIQYTQTYLPHVIICCMAIAEADGFTLLKTLRQDPTTAVIPVIFTTSKTARSDRPKAERLGVNAYLTKPCTIDELVHAITAQLERQALLHRHGAQPSYLFPPIPSSPAIQQSSPLCQDVESYDPPLKEALRYIATYYHRPIALSDVAQAVGYSPAYLTHLMGRQTGQTVQQWIIQHRMAAACTLLRETDQSVERIANQVGYHHVVHFFRQFRRFHGTTPQGWRNSQRPPATSSQQPFVRA